MIEKPKFVYTGSKESYDIKFYNGNKPAKIDERDRFICNICFYDHRSECVWADLMEAINFVKRNIEVKTIKGQRSLAQGKAFIYLIDKSSNEEFLAATITKNEKRYYEPVSRFDHSKGDNI